jgi:hypothetical protein
MTKELYKYVTILMKFLTKIRATSGLNEKHTSYGLMLELNKTSPAFGLGFDYLVEN